MVVCFLKKLSKDSLVQIRTRRTKQRSNAVGFILLIILSIFLIFLFKEKFQTSGHKKSEGSVTLVSSDGSRTNIVIGTNKDAVQVSTASANHNEPFSRGDFIVWTQEQQNQSEKYVVRYHVPTQTTVYVTSTGVSQNPKVNTQGQVVWQQWVHESWQIFFFDGFKTAQITNGEVTSINPDIAGHVIVFAQKSSDGIWQAKEYLIPSNEFKVIKEGTLAKHPYFYGKDLYFLDE